MIRAVARVTVASLLVATAAHATVPTTPRSHAVRARARDPEHARLMAMSGTWDVDMTLWLRPGGAGIACKATSTIRSLLNGLFIEEKIEGALNGTPFTTLAWTGFNSDTKQYEATRIATTNTPGSPSPVASMRGPGSSN